MPLKEKFIQGYLVLIALDLSLPCRARAIAEVETDPERSEG